MPAVAHWGTCRRVLCDLKMELNRIADDSSRQTAD
jgi:hypothetical protein